jgi:hypothetical protein
MSNKHRAKIMTMAVTAVVARGGTCSTVDSLRGSPRRHLRQYKKSRSEKEW